MKRIFFAVIILFGIYSCVFAQNIYFKGNTQDIYAETPATSTGLNKIYVIYSTSGVSMHYEAKNASASVKWYTYGNRGGGYAEELNTISHNGATTTLSQVIPNCGYIIEENDSRTYIWVVNYADYRLSLSSIEPATEQDCGSIALNVSGSGEDIPYTTINGVNKVLSRDIRLTYNSLEWDSDNMQWNDIEIIKSYESLKTSIHEQAPLCNTDFTLSGDKFLEFWDEDLTITSTEYTTHSIEVQTSAEQTERDSPNEKDSADDGSLGGSAPVEITFTAYPTDGVTQREWQLSNNSEFDTIERSITEDSYTETFNDAGTFYVRYVAKNATETCETYSETYTISIGESSLLCPNAFSPQGSPGVNDEWRVQYKSITSFKCWIFNRWGVQICQLNDPAQGWDGKYKGKYVSSGVYYYVIQAKGADGKEYKLKGDINIINYKGLESTGGDNSNEGVVE